LFPLYEPFSVHHSTRITTIHIWQGKIRDPVYSQARQTVVS